MNQADERARPASLTQRVVRPEWLDELPSEDPRAMRSRRDLQRVNLWMGNAAILAAALRQIPFLEPPRSLLDLGSGDGSLLLQIARRMAPCWPKLKAVLVDRQAQIAPGTKTRFAELGWEVQCVQADAAEWLNDEQNEGADVVLANLFLHHFSTEPLRRLLLVAAGKTRAFVACEPERSRRAYFATRLLRFIGCNEVTRHDGWISVAAGFRGRELTELWPSPSGWTLIEKSARSFSHLFVARKDSVRKSPG